MGCPSHKNSHSRWKSPLKRSGPPKMHILVFSNEQRNRDSSVCVRKQGNQSIILFTRSFVWLSTQKSAVRGVCSAGATQFLQMYSTGSWACFSMGILHWKSRTGRYFMPVLKHDFEHVKLTGYCWILQYKIGYYFVVKLVFLFFSLFVSNSQVHDFY